MKSEKGITLTSVTIYVIGMTIIIGIMVLISRFFYSNVEDTSENIDPAVEYTKFNSFFSDEVNHQNIKILEIAGEEENSNYIVFDNGVQYTFIKENQGIYRNQVKIAKNVTDCSFTTDIKNGKRVVTVSMTIGNMQRENTYTLQI